MRHLLIEKTVTPTRRWVNLTGAARLALLRTGPQQPFSRRFHVLKYGKAAGREQRLHDSGEFFPKLVADDQRGPRAGILGAGKRAPLFRYFADSAPRQGAFVEHQVHDAMVAAGLRMLFPDLGDI